MVPVLAGWIAFHGALRYDFAQDDWMRLEAASRPLAAQLGDALARGAQGRRPVEQLYFALAIRVAGDRPLAVHLLAGLLHSANVLLLLLLLRRLLRPGAALVGATFFACHVAGFTVLYWAACAPELLATFWSLLALLLATGAARRPAWWWAVPCYLLALGAKETPLLLPLVVWPLGRLAGLPVAAARRRAALLGAAGVAALLLYVLLKAGLSQPAYALDLSAGGVLRRLADYGVWAHAIWKPIPFVDGISGVERWVVLPLVALEAAAALAAGRRARRQAVAGLVWFAVMIAPAVLVGGHQYRYLLYLALPGVVLIWAPLGEGLLAGLAARREPHLVPAMLAALVAGVAALGATAAWRTESGAVPARGARNRHHFVVRRALLASRVLRQIAPDATRLGPRSAVLFMSRDRTRDWWDDNFAQALGGGAALRVRFAVPGLHVGFFELGDPPADLSPYDHAVLYLYDKDGILTRVREADLHAS